MSADADREFQEEIAVGSIVQWLSKSCRILMLVCIFQIIIQVGLVIWISMQCTTILGISLGGRIFYLDSLTCPIPGAPKLFPHS